MQNLLKRPKVQFRNVLQFALPIEVVFTVLATYGQFLGHFPNELLEHCQMIFVPVVVLSRLGIEEKVSSKELKYDTT